MCGKLCEEKFNPHKVRLQQTLENSENVEKLKPSSDCEETVGCYLWSLIILLAILDCSHFQKSQNGCNGSTILFCLLAQIAVFKTFKKDYLRNGELHNSNNGPEVINLCQAKKCIRSIWFQSVSSHLHKYKNLIAILPSRSSVCDECPDSISKVKIPCLLLWGIYTDR